MKGLEANIEVDPNASPKYCKARTVPYSIRGSVEEELKRLVKPLLGLLGEHKSASPQASAKIRRWSLYLSMFEYNLKFRRTTAHTNADTLSQLPLSLEPKCLQS